ncbi:MAG: DNA mismatch repair endonuclease MutL [Lacibacter sp.]
MPDIIQLLPDHIANQIAAGEVIQRPASAVKELLENAVDAGATSIQLIVNDAGKQLVQVIDNGCGMSETDARMAFERHATSKIRNIDDLFRIKTMGFRGEALASIAAVAQVELKTRREGDATGCYIEIENSQVRRQEPVATPVGTSIAMKNLFFNVPARRNFLKSNAAEMRHIVDEFIRVSMAHPERFFSLTANGQQLFHLEKGTLKQRILQLLGSTYNTKLVPVQEQTDYLNISGFIGKPETAKKTRGDQYLFVNKRFIKSAYLNHAVTSAFQELIPADSHPAYVLFLELDPAQVDINVHPTKQEIKFEDEKIVYAFVQAAVKHALAQFSITPTLDFDLDPSIQQLEAVSKPFTPQQQASATASGLYQTFTQRNVAHKIDPSNNTAALHHWRTFYDAAAQAAPPAVQQSSFTQQQEQPAGLPALTDQPVLQLHNCYLLATTTNGILLVHQQNAHERILYERYTQATEGKPMATQRSLFPATVHLSPQDAILLNELLPELQLLGYHVEPFGNNSFVIQGTPADVQQGNESNALELLLEQFKHYTSDLKFSRREKLVRSLARQHSIKAGTPLSATECRQLVEDLFACRQPGSTSNGLPTYTELKKEDLEKLFGR